MPKTLVVLVGGRRVGTVVQGGSGHLGLTYHESWEEFPLSLSMPLSRPAHGDEVVRAFLWGLLPDSDRVLDRWARVYQVSARNPFALLQHVGEDCAGAAQFVPIEREAELADRVGGVHPIDDVAIAHRLRVLRRDPTAWHVEQTGQFSLAGAQAKTALFHSDAAGWGDPWGAVPTTHILKPAVLGFDEHDLNEHLCLETARGLGLAAARSRVASFEDERVIVVDRYDRVTHPDGTLTRIHQEDMCQALGRMPTSKYQNEGGPSPESIIELLPPADASAFVDALAFNWLIAGTDAHAKNYSVLLDGAGTRLAPLYDVSSALPYDDMYLPRLRMAMRIGGEYSLEGLAKRHWQRFATANDLNADALIERIAGLAARLPSALKRAAEAPEIQALGSGLPEKLADRVTLRAARCADRLT